MALRLIRRVVTVGLLGAISIPVVTSPDPQETVTRLGYGCLRIGRVGVAVGKIMFAYSRLKKDASVEERKEVHRYGAAMALDVIKRNGGVYIKFGQHIAALQFLIPDEYTGMMRELQDSAPAVSYKEAIQVVCDDLGLKGIEERFRYFEEKPIASASLAQVHRAETLDGRKAAVKIQYPFLRKTLDVDMGTIRFATNMIVRIFPQFEFRWVADEFSVNLPLEIDFVNEGKNAEKAARLFKNNPHVVIPTIYWDLTTHRVLTMEFMEGCCIDDNRTIQEVYKLSGVHIGRILSQVFCEMIFIHGVVHADPHPGNILVRRNPHNPHNNEAQLVLLDHGLYRTVPDHLRLLYCEFWRALLSRNVEGINKVANHIIKLGNGRSRGKSEYAGGSAESDAKLFVSIVLARSWEKSSDFESTSISSKEQGYLREQATMYVDKIATVLDRVPSEFLLLFKTNDLLRSVNKNLGAPINGFAEVIWRAAVNGSEKGWVRYLALWRISFTFFVVSICQWLGIKLE